MFKVGDRVISKRYGEGIVEVTSVAFKPLPITFKFDNSEVRQSYTKEGCYWDSSWDRRNIKPIGNNMIRTSTINLDTGKDTFQVSVDYQVIPEEPGSYYQPYEPEDIEVKSFDILTFNNKPVDKIRKRNGSLFYSLLIGVVEENLSKAKQELIKEFKKQDEEDYVCYMAVDNY